MFKLILVPTGKCDNGLIMVRGKLEYHNTYLTQAYIGSIPATSYSILLINTEVEIVDCWYYQFETKEIRCANGGFGSDIVMSQFAKVIASTNKSHSACTCTPTLNTAGKVTTYPDPDCKKCYKPVYQLSPKSIQLLIDYYNGHQCMPESVDVEEELVTTLIKGRKWDDREACRANGSRPFYMKPVLVLNSDGELDITMPEEEKKYTTTDVIKYSYWLRNTDFNVEGNSPEDCLNKYFDENK